jgi:hypothetical protein
MGKLIRGLYRRPVPVIALALLLLVGLAGPARAFEFRSGNTVTIGSDEVINDDLFVSGSTVIVNGTVNGDLFAAGTNLEVNGMVNGSVFLAGQTLSVNGRVMGSLYGAGASATLGTRASIARNAAFAGYSLRSDNGSTVGRDLTMAGYQSLLGGQVARNVTFNGAALVLSGRVGGDVTARVGAPGAAPQIPVPLPGAPAPAPQGIRVTPETSIGGRLVYRSEVEQSGAIQSTPQGGVVYEPVEAGEEQPAPQPGAPPAARRAPTFGQQVLRWFLGVLRTLVTLLVVGVLALWLVPRSFLAAVGRARERTLASFGWGLLLWIGGWVIVVVAIVVILLIALLLGLVTLGGLAWVVLGFGLSSWGLFLTVFAFVLAHASKVVVSFLVGELLFGLGGRPYRGALFWPLLVGVTLFALVRTIPILGQLVSAAVTLIGLGALWLVWYDRRRRVAPPA